MQRLEKLQEKNNKLAFTVMAMGACIKEVRDCDNPFDAAERMHKMVDIFSATVNAFEELGDDVALVLESYTAALSGGDDAIC